MVHAMKDGDPDGAAIYWDRMTAAMSSRSPEHQQRLHAKAWQRMLDEDYFGAMGQRDAERGA
jgi:nitrous oxide reductase accessory protein NosL